MEAKKPLTVEEAAEYLGIAVGTLKNKCYKNTIPYHKPAGKMYFFESELRDWIKGSNENSNQPTQ